MGSAASVLQTQRQLYENLSQKIPIYKISQQISSTTRYDPNIYLGRVISTSTPLYSPLSQISCVFYLLTVEAYDDNENSFHIIANQFKQQNFYLIQIENDQIYSLHIPATSSSIKLISKTHNYQSIDDGNRTILYNILKSHNIDIHRYPEENLRLKEDLIQLGEMIGIFGTIRSYTDQNFQLIHELIPLSSNDIDSTWYNRNSFTQSEVTDWSRLLNTSEYLCTDDSSLLKGNHINPLPPNFDFGFMIPGYNHSLMGTSHKNPTAMIPSSQPMVSQILQPMIHQQSHHSMTVQQAPVLTIPMHMMSMTLPSNSRPTILMTTQQMPIYQQPAQTPQPVMSHQPMSPQYPSLTSSSSHQYLHQHSGPYTQSPYPPQQQYPSQQQYPPQQQYSYQQQYPPHQQYPPQQYPSQQYPQQHQYSHGISGGFQPQQSPMTPSMQPMPHHSQGYYPTQQPVQHHPGGYHQDPQYALPITQSLPIATPIYSSK